ncbi:MlaD family protein [Sphaerisporangium fuscum]|uniref:MlaD family protein n=1 Tax=Sphaerisporangium fuscum TaxID=2835868 RepID=UPI001BDDBC5A|nr:MlaD family protein [Sphaerisporangium fuscum]
MRRAPLAARLAVSVSLIAAVAALAYVIGEAGEPSGPRFTAVFGHSGQGLDTNSPVKIRGVTVGRVTGVELDGEARSVVAVRLDSGVRVPDTARATVEPVSVFGPKFLDLIPGAHEGDGPYLRPGARILRTEDPEDLAGSLARAYRGLAAVDPREVAVVVHTLAQGLDGKGGELRHIADDAGTLAEIAYRHRADARRFLADAAALSTSLAGPGRPIVAIARDVEALTPALLRRADEARALLREISAISALGAHGLNRHRADLRVAVNSGERAVALIYAQLGVAGDGVRSVRRLLGLLGGLTNAPGPAGANQLRVQAFLPADLCELVVGACGPSGGR